MGKRRRENPIIEGLQITAVAAEGKAMGHHEGKVVFVPGCVPGDVADVQIRSQRRRFMEGYVVRWIERSQMRSEPFCEHFGVCGGCSWQNLPYAEQLRFKQQQVFDQLSRIGHLELPEEGIRPILGSERTEFYRNKLEYTFSPRRWRTFEEMAAEKEIASDAEPQPEPALGFHIPSMFDKILDIRRCHLQPDPSNEIRLEIKRFCVERGFTFYDIRAHEGLMRNVVIRTASTGETMVIVVFGEDATEKREELMAHLATTFPRITSLMYVVNTKLNDSLGDQEAVLWSRNDHGNGRADGNGGENGHGNVSRDHIFERMEGLCFKIGPKSFYQTNSAQAYELYKVAREFAGLTGSETVYDLYTGTGTIANFVAGQAAQVVGIEYVREAIDDARENSALNGIANTIFYAGDMKKVLSDQFVAANGHPDVVILDPPRAGVDAPVIDVILRAAPETIVYVSCNPATQARDIALMAEKYRIAAVQPVDMFPHTHHVENVVKLIRKV